MATCLPDTLQHCFVVTVLLQGDLQLYESQGDAALNAMSVLQAVLASDSEPARAVQVCVCVG